MLNKPALCLAAALCVAMTVTHAQPADTLAGKLANFPTRLFSKIQSQSASLNQQIMSETQQYLARMSRTEQQMQQKLSAVDSNGSKTLFGHSQQQYAALSAQLRADTGGRPVRLHGQYVPYADTLQGAMAFLQQHSQALVKQAGTVTTRMTSLSGSVSGVNGAIPGVNGTIPGVANVSPQVQAKLQGAATEFQALQSKMNDAEIARTFVQSRQQQISQYIAQHTALAGVLGKSMSRMSQAQYYYSQKLQQYKAMFSNPSAMAQQALSMLAKLPAFQNFMSTHSQLGNLFHVPGSYSSAQAVNGLQTKAQVAQIVQNQVAAAGPSGASALQGNLQSAQSQLDGFKDKLSKLGLGNGDAQMPAAKTNDQHTKSLLGRLQYSFNFQTTHNSIYYPSLLTLGLGLGYNLGHSNIIGIGASYEMGTGNGINHIAITGNGLGLRSFATIKIKSSFSFYAGYEENYTTPFTSYQQLKQLEYWTRSGLAGLQKTISMKSTVFKQTTLALLFDFLSYQNVPATQPLIFRIGYSF